MYVCLRLESEYYCGPPYNVDAQCIFVDQQLGSGQVINGLMTFRIPHKCSSTLFDRSFLEYLPPEK